MHIFVSGELEVMLPIHGALKDRDTRGKGEGEREGAGEGERTHVFHPVSLRSTESPQVTLHMTEGQTSQYNTPFSSYMQGGGLIVAKYLSSQSHECD